MSSQQATSSNDDKRFTKSRVLQAVRDAYEVQRLLNNNSETAPSSISSAENEQIVDASTLFSVVRQLGLDHLTLAQVTDVFRQIRQSRQKQQQQQPTTNKNSPQTSLSTTPPAASLAGTAITVDDVMEWMGTIVALNDTHGGGSPVHHHHPSHRATPRTALTNGKEPTTTTTPTSSTLPPHELVAIEKSPRHENGALMKELQQQQQQHTKTSSSSPAVVDSHATKTATGGPTANTTVVQSGTAAVVPSSDDVPFALCVETSSGELTAFPLGGGTDAPPGDATSDKLEATLSPTDSSSREGGPSSLSSVSQPHLAPGSMEEALSRMLVQSGALQATQNHHHHGSGSSAHSASSSTSSTASVEDVVASLMSRGFGDVLAKIVREAAAKPEATVQSIVSSSVEGNGGKKQERSLDVSRRTLAFSSSLALRHVGSGTGASMSITATLLFVDISGYSAVTSAMEGMGAHALSAVVNGYLEKIVRVIRANGGDVVKFAGDALLAVWCTEGELENCVAATKAACTLLRDYAVEPVPMTTLSFGLHCGIAHGRCTSRIFSPRKLRANDMPTHFHFLSGSPLNEVGEACSLATRGEVVIHSTVLDFLTAATSSSSSQTGKQGTKFTTVPVESNPEEYHKITEIDVREWMGVASPDKALLGVTTVSAASGGSAGIAGEFERYFVPPKVSRVLDSGMDQFYMAEMRELVIVFLHFAETTDVEVWFDEVFHVLENFGCDVVQIIDDDKGVHIVAALNLYLMAERSIDASIGIGLALRAKHCDSHIGVAAGTVFCGVLGSKEACQWDISGAACVRAARLMQYAVANDLTACFDESIFAGARDRSNLKALEPIAVKGSPDPVCIYTLREMNVSQRASTFQTTTEKVPMLSFHQSLCPLVHHKTISEVRRVLQLPTAVQVAMEASEKARQRTKKRTGGEDGGGVTDSGSVTPPSRPSSGQSGVSHHASTAHASSGTVKMVVLTGTGGTGKFSLAVNSLSESSTVPIVHECYERHTLTQLLVVQTLALWFSFSKIPPIRQAAELVLKTFRDHRHNEAFSQAIALVLLVAQSADRRFALIVRGAQFLDQSSVSFLGIASKKLEATSRFYFLVTCSPLYGYPEPEKKFSSFGNVKVFEIATITDGEVRHLFSHCVQQKADDRVIAFVTRKTSNHVECVVELAKYVQRRTLLQVGSDGLAKLRPTAMDEVEKMLWGDISSTIRLKAIHVLDHLTPELLTMCKIIASITEQPLISAFFYSVSKVCQVLQKSELNVGDVRTLDSLWLLKMCEHRCTAHSGTGELDAAVFLVPAMRDVAQSLLVPQQRTAINKICGDCYSETHPMDHPMQYLVRARHYLFAGDHAKYVHDLSKGWSQLLAEGASIKIKDHAVIKGRFFDWMREVEPGAETDLVLNHHAATIKEFEAYSRKMRFRAQGSMMAGSGRNQQQQRSFTGGSRASNAHGADLAIARLLRLLTDHRYYPLEFGAAEPAMAELVQSLQLLLQASEQLVLNADAAGPRRGSVRQTNGEDPDDSSIATLLDTVKGNLTSYILSFTYCLTGTTSSTTTSSSTSSSSSSMDNLANTIATLVVPLKQYTARLDSEEFLEVVATTDPCWEPEGSLFGATNELLGGTRGAVDDEAREQLKVLKRQKLEEATTVLKAEVLAALQTLQEHVEQELQPLCETLRHATDEVLEQAFRTSVALRRKTRYTGVCAFAEALQSIRDDPSSAERGDVLVSLFENLSTILEVYCPGSNILRRIFCDGMEEYFLGTLQPPETHAKLRQTLAVFWRSWLNCCAQQLLFY